MLAGMEDLEILMDPVTEYIKEHCLPELMPTAEVRLRPSGLMVPKEFPNYLDRIRNFQVRSDDIWVISFPKCGEQKTYK